MLWSVGVSLGFIMFLGFFFYLQAFRENVANGHAFKKPL